MNKLNKVLINTLMVTIFSACSQSNSTSYNPELDSSDMAIRNEQHKKVEQRPMSSCSIYNGRNWHAWLDKKSDGNTYLLNVTGEVDLPTPGYIVDWSPGMMDRMQPPGLKMMLATTPPKGMSLQVITPQKLNLSMETPIGEFRHVSIYCGEKLLVSIPDVEFKD